MKRVQREIDLQNPPSLNGEQQAAFHKSADQLTTGRVDSDVFLWLKSQGKGHQTCINAILREAMPWTIGDKA